MALKIPRNLKKEFKKGFGEYIAALGRKVEVYLEPYHVACPNCIYNTLQKKSSNIYDETFKTPVTIFPGTFAEDIVYPEPFNVVSVSGVQFNPIIPNPKILDTNICPVCMGEGTLTSPNKAEIFAVVDKGYSTRGTSNIDLKDLSAGKDGIDVFLIKTYPCNYSILRDSLYLIVDGIKCNIELPPRLKGIGEDALVEAYLGTVKEDFSSSDVYDTDDRLNVNTKGQVSNQAPPETPTIPPRVPGDDVW